MGTPAGDIVFTRHAARRGIAWLKDAYALLSKARAAWLILLIGYYIAMLLVDLLPFVGNFAALLLKPVFAVGFLAAAWTQERGGRIAPSLLFLGFRSNMASLLAIGLVYVAGFAIATQATRLVDGGLLLDALQAPPPEAGADPQAAYAGFAAALREPRVLGGILFGMFCALPTLFAVWFAPGLVVFQDAGPVTALGASLRGALGNWRPIVAFGLAILLFGGIIPAMIFVPLAALVGPVIAYLVLAPYLLFFAATLHVADYVGYRDIFHAGETLAPLAQSQDGGRG